MYTYIHICTYVWLLQLMLMKSVCFSAGDGGKESCYESYVKIEVGEEVTSVTSLDKTKFDKKTKCEKVSSNPEKNSASTDISKSNLDPSLTDKTSSQAHSSERNDTNEASGTSKEAENTVEVGVSSRTDSSPPNVYSQGDKTVDNKTSEKASSETGNKDKHNESGESLNKTADLSLPGSFRGRSSAFSNLSPNETLTPGSPTSPHSDRESSPLSPSAKLARLFPRVSELARSFSKPDILVSSPPDKPVAASPLNFEEEALSIVLLSDKSEGGEEGGGEGGREKEMKLRRIEKGEGEGKREGGKREEERRVNLEEPERDKSEDWSARTSPMSNLSELESDLRQSSPMEIALPNSGEGT